MQRGQPICCNFVISPIHNSRSVQLDQDQVLQNQIQISIVKLNQGQVLQNQIQISIVISSTKTRSYEIRSRSVLKLFNLMLLDWATRSLC
uniref:Uncharacterized protein n=1 Tax=Globodera rostochiensis TaxID=31243 RepID=A0A914HJ02_GLORO